MAYIKVEYMGLSGWVKKAYLQLPEPPQAMEGSEEEGEESDDDDDEEGERPG